MGAFTPGGQITLIDGWNWYFGSDASGIAQGQYDFQTVVIHELGHVLGLGENADPLSAMSLYLSPGQARRYLTANDKTVIAEEENGNPDPLLAAPIVAGLRENISSTAVVETPLTLARSLDLTSLWNSQVADGNGMRLDSLRLGASATYFLDVHDSSVETLILAPLDWRDLESQALGRGRHDLRDGLFDDEEEPSEFDTLADAWSLTRFDEQCHVVFNDDAMRVDRSLVQTDRLLETVFSNGIGMTLKPMV